MQDDPLTECENCGTMVPLSDTSSCPKCNSVLCPGCVCETCENERDD